MDENQMFQSCIEQAQEHILKAQAFVMPFIVRMSGRPELFPLLDLSGYLQKARSAAKEISRLEAGCLREWSGDD